METLTAKNEILIATWLSGGDVDIVEVANKDAIASNRVPIVNFYRIRPNGRVKDLKDSGANVATIVLDNRRTDFKPATDAEIDRYIPKIIRHQLAVGTNTQTP
jgi:hypothetical protein